MRIFSTWFKCFEAENAANPSLKTSQTIYMTLSQRITQVGKIPTSWSCRNSTKSMSTRSPHRVDRLCFLLRREPTIRTAENLERRSSLSLLKMKTQSTASLAHFWSSKIKKMTIPFLFYSHLLFSKILNVSFFLIFDTWHNLSHPSHPLSTHATCVTWVHVVCDFCHIICLSNPFYSTRHPVPRKT